MTLYEYRCEYVQLEDEDVAQYLQEQHDRDMWEVVSCVPLYIPSSPGTEDIQYFITYRRSF